ncbi:MAG: 2-hydroxychromene-2-carboxylate isomerase [Gammaproteobacteria bacterium]|nr:2-hydroxychromene-2-carboxylate isomerase [Gammaproteobacteria bacterium]
MEKRTLDYYLSLQSPWTYLGHDRVLALAAAHDVEVELYPVDFGVIFPATGGLPLPKRAPERRAYRMAELERWSEYLNLSLNLKPRHFPVDEKLATRVVVSARRESTADAIALTGRILSAVWSEERDIADPETLREIIESLNLDADELLEKAGEKSAAERIVKDTDRAIARGVFGAPTYIVDSNLFWGQDRLDFVERQLAKIPASA